MVDNKHYSTNALRDTMYTQLDRTLASPVITNHTGGLLLLTEETRRHKG